MGEFFRGWRRKTGCVTLVMACALTAIWVRTDFRADRTDPVVKRADTKTGKDAVPDVKEILRQVSELVLSFGKDQAFWTDRTLIDIANVQMRAQDFEGARKSILSSQDHHQRQTLDDLAEAYARHGKLEEAIDVLHVPGSDDKSKARVAGKGIRTRWVEHLIASGQLDAALKELELAEAAESRLDGLRKLAIAHGAAHNVKLASQLLATAAEEATFSGDYDALLEIADAQLSLGAVDAAMTTTQTLISRAERSETWQKVRWLSLSAVLTAQAGDKRSAERLFATAIDACNQINTGNDVLDNANKGHALAGIAVDQVSVGDLTGAIRTAALIGRNVSNAHSRPDHDLVLYAISVAQTVGDDIPAAQRTAKLIEQYPQYRDDALAEIVAHEIRNRRYSSSLSIAQEIEETLFRAINVLTVANAHAKAGEVKAAIEVAMKVSLRSKDNHPLSNNLHEFDYRQPSTWIAPNLWGGTMNMMRRHHERSAAVAANAMTLSQYLRRVPDESYAVVFKDVSSDEVIRALARAHAAAGDPNAALAWAREVGAFRVKVKIGALIGVAEGVLDSTTRQEQAPLRLGVRLKTILYGQHWLRRHYRANGSLVYWQMNPLREHSWKPTWQ